ncbi:Firmicute transcriptional repressor of class III stress genes (CtsR) [Acididesulfobacillus acetoxydans]|uniref:Transcriptional regulator CtsR n=1 Tax=Acididesulfobacillus acetoxydans TaxID=1561005 RepID=A0A8S0X3F1_9FIRM|nr:CtsR family transcriptional regulator [Acididesulfobacillus acetoxydans]CAA7600040.1 Firmicute transcriptional repressor of class III stress genes (CtsR) [Acididesulfobacillus acetoxydans]CEJ07815.1 Transcriptional regulator [Acididesulfobacillus acetoxydans]
MGNLADRIEQYIKEAMARAEEGYVVLQRGILAEAFSCAPSQINYVLDTRFTVERGYLVESRRGGGGYLRIVRLEVAADGLLHEVMGQLIGDSVSLERANGLLARLYDEEILTAREAAIIKSILSREALGGRGPEENALRARLMKRIITTLCREDLQ